MTQEKQPCCEKCKGTATTGRFFVEVYSCANPACPCHKSTEKGCICPLFQTPYYHASDNPHSVEMKWNCPVHGKQEIYWLTHEDKQEGCVGCKAVSDTAEKGHTTRGFPENYKKWCTCTKLPCIHFPTTDTVEWRKWLFPHADTAEKYTGFSHSANCNDKHTGAFCHSDATTDTSDFSKFIREASPEEKKKVWLEIAKDASADQRAAMVDTSDWRERFAKEIWDGDDWTLTTKQRDIVEAFLSKEIERAREEERTKGTLYRATYDNGFEAGKREGHNRHVAECNKRFDVQLEAGRTATLSEVKEVSCENCLPKIELLYGSTRR